MDKINSSIVGCRDDWPQVWAEIIVESGWTAKEWIKELNDNRVYPNEESEEEILLRVEKLLDEYRKSKNYE